jgi:hypothetical protein
MPTQDWSKLMPTPGWLKIGLHLLCKEAPNEMFRVTDIRRGLVYLAAVRNPSDNHHRTRVGHLHSYYWAPSYFECDDCRRKPGSSTPCSNCFNRRSWFHEGGGGRKRCELPKFCSKPYREYDPLYLPMGPTEDNEPRIVLSRYKRPWVI